MYVWRQQLAKLVIWLTAGVIPVQPLLALDCACDCCVVTAGETTCQHASCDDARCVQNHSECHDHIDQPQQLDASNLDAPGKLIARETIAEADATKQFWIDATPCHCPTDCDCFTRHQQRVAAVESTKIELDPPTAIVIADAELLLRLVAADQARSWALVCPTNPGSSALARCALLCRFTS